MTVVRREPLRSSSASSRQGRCRTDLCRRPLELQIRMVARPRNHLYQFHDHESKVAAPCPRTSVVFGGRWHSSCLAAVDQSARPQTASVQRWWFPRSTPGRKRKRHVSHTPNRMRSHHRRPTSRLDPGFRNCDGRAIGCETRERRGPTSCCSSASEVRRRFNTSAPAGVIRYTRAARARLGSAARSHPRRAILASNGYNVPGLRR